MSENDPHSPDDGRSWTGIPGGDRPGVRLSRVLALTRAGMVAERALQAFWPLVSLAFAIYAALAFGLTAAASGPVLLGLGAVATALLLWSGIHGVRRFHWPGAEEARARLDATLPGRPLTALSDSMAVGANDPQSQAVWQAHLRRMAERAATARAPAPELRLAPRDPYALRLVAGTAFAAALLFGAADRVTDVPQLGLGAGEAAASAGPAWEGWVEPPLYTQLPSLYLNDIDRESFEAPEGSRITIRFYGAEGALTLRETVTAPAPTDDPGVEDAPPAASFDLTLDRPGELAIEGPGGQSWRIGVIEDQAPEVAMGEDGMTVLAPGQMQMPFSASDDYAVISGRATITLDPDAADRRYGLAVEPEPREPLVLDLPMPFSGSRAEFTELLVEDLAEHPFANLPVSVTLTVTDHAGQIGTVTEPVARLPGRRFYDPVANALIEMRRDLLWSRENARRVVQVLRAVTHRPEGLFDDDGAYLMARTAIRRLEAHVDGISEETRDQVAELLWNAAIILEEGDLADALERLRRAQDRLAEAMRQGASDEEIAELMDELRDAMDDYMRQLAENASPGDDTDQPDQQGETLEMSMADLEEMLRRIEELMQQGRMAEAQELMEAFRQMMENMQITQGDGSGDGPMSPGQQAMEGLRDTLREQQDLSDDSFSELQDRFNPNRPQQGQQGQQQPGQRPGPQGQQGQPRAGQGQQQQGEGQAAPGEQGQAQPGEGGPDGLNPGAGQGGENDGRSLAERQQDLLRQLQEQAQNLPGTGSEAGEEAERLLDEAGRAMDEAADALEGDDLAGALDSQSRAMEALREGMSRLGEALAQEQGTTEPGQGQADGTAPPDRPLQDPLGRQAGNSGALGTDEDFEAREEAFRRARELLDEIRRRSAEQDRPDLELDYLRRLLDQF